MHEKRSQIDRPLNPTPSWVQYETEHAHLTQPELKKLFPRLHAALILSDELHFVPQNKEELARLPKDRPTSPERMTITLGDVFETLKVTARTVGIAPSQLQSQPLFSVDAANVRSRVAWRDESRQEGLHGAGKRYYYSPRLAEAIALYHIDKNGDISKDQKDAWKVKIKQHYAQA